MPELLASMHRHRQAIFALLMIAVVVLLLWMARGALPAFFIGLALAFVLDPAVTLLARHGMPRWAGVVVMYIAVVAIVWALIAFALPPISRQTSEFIAQLPELGASVGDIGRGVEDWYLALPLPAEFRSIVDQQVAASGQAFADVLRGLLAPTLNALVRVATFTLGLVVVPVWLFFVLKDRAGFSRGVAGAMPPSWRADAENLLGLLGRIGGRWVRGQLLLGASIFAATTVGLTILTVIGFAEFGQFTLVLALIAGLLEWFPIIGPIVAAVPAILIGLSIGFPAAIAAAVLYIGIQQLENNILVPKVMGDAVELHPAVMILALVVGGALFGIGGAILAAPTVAAGRDLYRYGFHRFGGQLPADAFELAKHGTKRVHVDDESPPPQVPPSEAEASLA
ncbi:MAG: AI-2E family transporter [Chloroflexi bacterium]|nr:AI-2E family transporter [Chloroflexota bacterium]MBA3739540.1 AI-2E family transporter [Chloroflexota bacterium]